MSVPVVAGALMRFPLGILSQYIGRKRAAMLELSIIMLCLGSGYLLVRSYAAVIAMGVALGVAGASFGVALSLGAGSYPARYKGLAMGIAGAGNSGSVLALLFAPPLAHAYGWRAVYGISVAPIAITLVLLTLFAREPADREDDKKLSDYLKILIDRDAWVLNLVYSVSRIPSLDGFLLPGSGHNLNVMPNAREWFTFAMTWLTAKLPPSFAG